MREFLTNNTIILQILGGIITFIVGVIGLFKKDTVKKGTHKLTPYGWFLLSTIIFGTLISGFSKYYDFKTTKEISRKKDSTINAQNLTLSAIQKQQDDEASYNNPLWPLIIKYSLTTKISTPDFDDLLSSLGSINPDITKLTDEQIRTALKSSTKKLYDDIITNNNTTMSHRVMFTMDTTKIVYLSKPTSRLVIFKKDNEIFLLDSLEFTTSTPFTDKTKLSQLRKFNFEIHRSYFSKIPDGIVPTLASDITLIFPKQNLFIIKTDKVIEYPEGSKKYEPRLSTNNFVGPEGNTNLIFTVKLWDLKDPFERD